MEDMGGGQIQVDIGDVDDPVDPKDANRRSVQTKVRGVFESVRGVCGTHRRRRNGRETLHGAVFRLLVMRGPLRGWTDDEAHELEISSKTNKSITTSLIRSIWYNLSTAALFCLYIKLSSFGTYRFELKSENYIFHLRLSSLFFFRLFYSYDLSLELLRCSSFFFFRWHL